MRRSDASEYSCAEQIQKKGIDSQTFCDCEGQLRSIDRTGAQPVACGDVSPAVLELTKPRSEEAGNVRYGLTVLQFQNNARRDNLDGFWSQVYGRNHALMVVSGFFENVPTHLYEKRELKTDEKASNTVLQFNPRPAVEMLVACLWDHWTKPGESDLWSYSAITDNPPPEIAATGHQRCIIALRENNVREWLEPEGVSRERLEAILSDKEMPYYEHRIAA